MTASSVSPITRPVALRRIAAVVAILLSVVDIVGVIVYIALPVPIFINVAILVLAALTIVGAIFAWRGASWGLWLAAVTRFLSCVPLALTLLSDGAPADVVAPTWIQVIVTLIDIVLLIVVFARRTR